MCTSRKYSLNLLPFGLIGHTKAAIQPALDDVLSSGKKVILPITSTSAQLYIRIFYKLWLIYIPYNACFIDAPWTSSTFSTRITSLSSKVILGPGSECFCFKSSLTLTLLDFREDCSLLLGRYFDEFELDFLLALVEGV